MRVPDGRTIVIRPVSGAWLRLDQHLAALGEYTDLLRTLSRHRLRVRYKQTALGFAWAVLQPLLMMVIFTAVFSVLARMPSDGHPYALFAYAALLPWTFFSTAVSNATGSLVTHTQLVTKVYFPREILPLTYVLAGLFDFAIGFVVLLGLMAWFDVPLTVHALNLIPIVFLLAAWILAVALVLSALQVRFRDVGVALPVLLQVWMFASPVIYPLSVVPQAWRGWYLLNPMAGIVASCRDVLLEGTPPAPVPLAMALIVTAAVLPAAYFFFKHAEATMADVI
ncbi:MAG TPA: ABC transporter permease [Vicinamibacterales bacterium]|nr:ABC transporter permease [Vicinamibacterales bacterium]